VKSLRLPDQALIATIRRTFKIVHFCTVSALAMPVSFPASHPWPALEKVMKISTSHEYFAELMQRLLEIQKGGRQRSSKLIAEDGQLMAGLRRKTLAGKSAPTAKDRSQAQIPG
jgi:hypothetical protein